MSCVQSRIAKTDKDAWTWEGKDTHKWSTTRGASKRNQSVPANPADRPHPETPAVPWRDIGDLNMDPRYLYPDHPADEESSVPKNDYLSKENQQSYTQWIEKILDLDRRTSKDPRLYCGYCDVNNHPRFARKRTYKHQKPNEKHRCTLCTAFHPPLLCSRAQINGGSGKPNWSRIEDKRAKQESREPDLRWEGFSKSKRSSTATVRSSSHDAWFVQGSIKFMAGNLPSNC